MNHPHVLVISDDSEFARALAARWQVQHNVPTITVLSSDLWSSASPAGYELVIVGPVRNGQTAFLLDTIDLWVVPAICVTSDQSTIPALQAGHARLLVVPQREGWADALIQVASETLRRLEAVARARRAEQAAAASRAHATLGHYMLEMHHSVNDALTSVLGNADLLLLVPGQFSAQAREQVQTIHTMALRLHEIMQRFSSLANEAQLTEKESQGETPRGSASLVSDS